MKKILLLSILTVLISCKNDAEKAAERNKYFLDSLKIDALAREKVKEHLLNAAKERYLDTTGTGISPIIIISSKLPKEEYSNRKNIKLTYKNRSKKDIQAIRFEWYGENSFNEPAEMGDYSNPGEGGGFSDDLLRSGKSETSIFAIYSKDAKKIITARAYEVAFTDGTVWKLRKE